MKVVFDTLSTYPYSIYTSHVLTHGLRFCYNQTSMNCYLPLQHLTDHISYSITQSNLQNNWKANMGALPQDSGYNDFVNAEAGPSRSTYLGPSNTFTSTSNNWSSTTNPIALSKPPKQSTSTFIQPEPNSLFMKVKRRSRAANPAKLVMKHNWKCRECDRPWPVVPFEYVVKGSSDAAVSLPRKTVSLENGYDCVVALPLR